jgi:hypothetical protein
MGPCSRGQPRAFGASRAACPVSFGCPSPSHRRRGRPADAPGALRAARAARCVSHAACRAVRVTRRASHSACRTSLSHVASRVARCTARPPAQADVPSSEDGPSSTLGYSDGSRAVTATLVAQLEQQLAVAREERGQCALSAERAAEKQQGARGVARMRCHTTRVQRTPAGREHRAAAPPQHHRASVPASPPSRPAARSPARPPAHPP